MLYRKRTLLYLLHEAGRAVNRLELVKWAFLMAKETPSRGGNAFYQFLPYKFGPFSFTLYREVDDLVRIDLVKADKTCFWISSSSRLLSIEKPPRTVMNDIDYIIEKYGSIPLQDQVDYVYRHYPLYTINSEYNQRSIRPKAETAVYTLGYEGLHIDGFLDIIIRKGIRGITDVRGNPIARRYGFHKNTLHSLCERTGLHYRCYTELGVNPNKRQNLRTTDDYNRLFADYLHDTLDNKNGVIQEIAETFSRVPSVLICMEADPSRCHRSIVARRLSEITSLPVIHLRSFE